MKSLAIRGEYRLLLCGDLPNINNFMALWISINTIPYGSETSYAYSPTVLIRSQPHFVRTLLIIGEYKLLLFLVTGQVLTTLLFCRPANF